MRQTNGSGRRSSEKIVKDIKRATRKQYSSEEKIRIVLDGLRGEDSIAELCRREGISQGVYYKWSKDFMEAGKRRLAGDTARAANTDEVKDLRREARDLKEVERGVQVDHATLNRWVVKYSPDIAKSAQQKKQSTAGSWRMDETYIKVKGKWMYLYRAIDKHGKTLDFMLSKRRDKATARLFFRRAIETNGLPSRIVIDKSGANLAGLQRINVGLKLSHTKQRIEILRVKYLNNIVEQDHRFIKKITRPTLGFKAFHSAAATLAGIEVAHMIRKQQLQSNHASPFKQFASLAV